MSSGSCVFIALLFIIALALQAFRVRVPQNASAAQTLPVMLLSLPAVNPCGCQLHEKMCCFPNLMSYIFDRIELGPVCR